MEVAIYQFMLRAEEQVFKKHFEILTRGVDAFLQIVVVTPLYQTELRKVWH